MKNNSTKTRIYDQQGLNKSQAWSKERSKKQAGKFFRLIVLAFVVILILTVAVQIPGLISKIQKPFPFIQSKFANYGDINTNHRTNILLVTEFGKKLKELGFISFENGNNKIKLFSIDPNTKIHTVKSSGSFSDLAFQNNQLNIDRLEVALVSSLGYVFDGYIVVNDNIKWINQQKLEKLIDDFYSPGFLLRITSNKAYLDRKIRTNLTFNEANNLIWFSKGLAPERVSFLDLTQSKDSNGFLDQQDASNKIGLLLTDDSISNAEVAVEVENASFVPGVGNILKNVITNLGGNVLSVTSGDEIEKTTLLVKNKNNPLGKRLETILGVKMQQAKSNDVFEGDIKVSIGNDYGSFFDF